MATVDIAMNTAAALGLTISTLTTVAGGHITVVTLPVLIRMMILSDIYD